LAFSVKNTRKKSDPASATQPGHLAVDAPAGSGAQAATPPLLERYCPDLLEIRAKAWKALKSPFGLAILALSLVVVTLAYQARPTYDIKLGGGFDTPYLNQTEGGFGRPVATRVAPAEAAEGESNSRENAQAAATLATAPEETNLSYRWTRERPILLLPGIGAAPARLTLQASGSPLYTAGQQVEVLVNGQPFSNFELKPGPAVIKTFDIPASRLNGGNLALEMRVKPLGQPDTALITRYPGTFIAIDKQNGQTLYQGQTGFKLYTARVEAAPGAAGFVLPPVSVLLAVAVSSWLLYFGLAYAGVRRDWAFGAAAACLVALGLILAFGRLSLTIYTGRLAILLLVTVLMLPVLDWLVPRLLRLWKLPLPKWAWQALLVMFIIGMIGRGGGVLYPHTEVIDAPYHLREINNILNDKGGLLAGMVHEFQNKALSKVPDQWGNQAVIPYSTISYFYLAPVAALPVDPAISVNLFNALLDAFRVFIVFSLAATLGAGTRASVAAAGFYLIIPCTWMLNSWGNWPTTVSFWLSTVYLLLALIYWQRLDKLWPWLLTTFVLILTMLTYTVTAVFMGILVGGWGLGVFLFGGRREKADRRPGLFLLASVAAASVFSILFYYIQFLPDLTATLGAFDKSLSEKGSLGAFGDRPLDFYLGLYADHVFFRYGAGIFIVAALVVYAWLLFNRKPQAGEAPANRELLESDEANLAALRRPVHLWLAGMWFFIFMFFGLAQWKVDMVDKQVWFVLPLVAALAGVGAVWTWQRFKTPALYYGTRLIITGLILRTTYSALTLWFDRVFIKRR
jgi:hypothetical protein